MTIIPQEHDHGMFPAVNVNKCLGSLGNIYFRPLNIREYVIYVTYVTQAEKYRVLNGDNDITESNVTNGQGSCLTLLYHSISHVSHTTATTTSDWFQIYPVIAVRASGNSFLSFIIPAKTA